MTTDHERIVMYLSWLWPWKRVKWVYCHDGVIIAHGVQYWWKVAITSACLKILDVMLVWCDMMEMKGSVEIIAFDAKGT